MPDVIDDSAAPGDAAGPDAKHPDAKQLRQTVVMTLLRAADEYQNRLVRLLREHKLTPSQYNVLRILRDQPQPMPVLEISSRLIKVVPAITGLIKRLESAGLVERTRDRQDRRVMNIELTSAGHAKLADLTQPVCQMHADLLGHVSTDDLGESLRLLRLLRESVVDGRDNRDSLEDEPIGPLDC